MPRTKLARNCFSWGLSNLGTVLRKGDTIKTALSKQHPRTVLIIDLVLWGGLGGGGKFEAYFNFVCVFWVFFWGGNLGFRKGTPQQIAELNTDCRNTKQHRQNSTVEISGLLVQLVKSSPSTPKKLIEVWKGLTSGFKPSWWQVISFDNKFTFNFCLCGCRRIGVCDESGCEFDSWCGIKLRHIRSKSINSGSFGGLWVHMAWKKNIALKQDCRNIAVLWK